MSNGGFKGFVTFPGSMLTGRTADWHAAGDHLMDEDTSMVHSQGQSVTLTTAGVAAYREARKAIARGDFVNLLDFA